MKKSLLYLIFLLPALNGHSQGLDSLIVERYYISNAADSIGSVGNLPVGSTTYRIFVDMAPGYKFQAAYGNANHELRLETTTSFFNNEDRGATTPTYTKPQARQNTVMLDSWLSVGAACAGNFGILKSQDNGVANVVNLNGILQNANPMAGIPLTVQDGLIAGSPQPVTTVGIDNEILIFDATSGAGNLFSTHNGAWSALNGAKGPTPENRVLIAQMTTNGVFTFTLNIQIKDTVNNAVEQYVASNPIGNEIQNPTLTYTSNFAPLVNITSPTSTSLLAGGDVINITADASDLDGSVTKVEFYVNGIKIGEDLTSPYSFPWTCVTGIDTLTAKATDNYGSQTISSKVIVTVGTAVVDIMSRENQKISLYPNPASSSLTLKISSPGENKASNYSIYSVTGARLLNKNLGTFNNQLSEVIDISTLAPGGYMIQVTANGKTSSHSFTKN